MSHPRFFILCCFFWLIALPPAAFLVHIVA